MPNQLSPTHNGVLIPEDMRGASVQELDAYATKVREGNRAFIRAHWALVDAAERQGVELGEGS